MDDSRSERSGTSGGTGGLSETSSQRSDQKILLKRQKGHDAADEGDLLEQKRTLQDGVFACMYTLVRQSALNSWQFTVIKVVLEGLMGFIVAFNPGLPAWHINTSNPVWQIVRWTLWRSPIMRLYGYDTYVTVMYVMAAIVLVAVLGLVWLTLAMRKTEQAKWLRHAALALHVLFDVVFMMCYISFFDFFVFMANCNFGAVVKHHMYFQGVMCLEMPHLLHMIIACFTAVVFFCITAAMVVASCDLNPISKAHLASPAAYTRLKILCAKAVYVIASDDLEAIPKWSAVIVSMCVGLIIWWNFRTMPFYRKTVNVIWCSMWFGILYTAVLGCVSVFAKDQSVEAKDRWTMMVLYGIFPVIAGGCAIGAVHVWWTMRPAKKFTDLKPGFKVSKVHKFEDVHEVERLARVMRVFDDDGVADEAAAALGETIIKAGMQNFSNSPFLYILYANFLLEVKKDGPASRTQLQLAAKHAPSLVERYQIFCTYESSKRLKDSQEGGMDLQAYIEFKRNYRAVIRVHKEALTLQNELWRTCLKSTVSVTDVDKALDALEVATGRANQVYKRVLERYPANGKLLRCYGKFLEDVKHDPAAAARAYGEANRNGGGDAMLSLDLSGVQGAAGKPDFLTSMSMEDAVIVINAEGTILMVSQAVQGVFGYPKAELEGVNVSLLMPQPFSQRHQGYLQRYTSTGVPHILDQVREVVALHKERYVFPISLCVTKMSGTGTDSIFLAVVRPLPPNLLAMRAWLAPNGTFLCGDQQFASMCGITEGELIGRSLEAMVDTPEVVGPLLERCREASMVELEAGTITAQLSVRHRYLDPVPVDVSVGAGGTDGQRILILSCRRTDGETGNVLVVDSHMRVKFAACGVAQLLGYPMRKLATMRLDQLLPPPFNTLHAKWIRDPPTAVASTSCRKGMTVNLVNEGGSHVPVHVNIAALGSSGDSALTHYVCKIDKAPFEEELEEKRVVLTADFMGRVLSASRPGAELFGFANSSLVGASLCDFIDIFGEWRERNGESQLQLLLLALLDKEQEMPGTSWRVRVSAPPSDRVPHLPAVPGAKASTSKAPLAKSACMQVELYDDEAKSDGAEGGGGGGGEASADGVPKLHVRVVLWRRDLLTGVLELDDRLVVRRASTMTGLIVGLPASAMLKKPLTRFLDVPPDKSWEQITSAYIKGQKKGALKGGAAHAVVSPPMAFIGPHPDTGTTRIIMQGVQSLGPNGKAKVSVMWHPDTTFTGAHANLMRVLKLEASSTGVAAVDADAGTAAQTAAVTAHGDSDSQRTEAEAVAHEASHKRTAVAGQCASHNATSDDDAAGDELDTPADPDDADRHSGSEGSGLDGEPNPAAQPGAQLHRQATSKSDFVAQWVRTLTKQVSGAASAASRQVSSGFAAAAGRGRAVGSGALVAIPEDGQEDEGGLLDLPRAAPELDHALSGGLKALRDGEGRAVSPGGGGARPGREGGGEGREDREADGKTSDKGSEADESEADNTSQGNTSISGITDSAGTELMVDARRGRLLKALNKLLLGPVLMAPMQRLRLHSYALLVLMLATHIGCYIAITNIITQEHTNVYLVHRQAMAMDRGQLVIVRAMMGAFCEQPGIAKVSVCENSLNYTLGKLRTNLDLMEEYHQGVYLGFEGLHKPAGEVYSIWTKPKLEYDIYLDTSPPHVVKSNAGVWALGNRFIAAGREALFQLTTTLDHYTNHRTYQFLLTNGLGALYTGYAESLDHLVANAWDSIIHLRTALVVLLVVEALVVQVLCTAYQWVLVQRVEAARLVGILAMLGLPGPVLRQLATKVLKVVDDSDDSDDDNDDDVGGEEEQQQQRAKDRQAAAGGESKGGGAAEGWASGVLVADAQAARGYAERSPMSTLPGGERAGSPAVRALAGRKEGLDARAVAAEDGGGAAGSQGLATARALPFGGATTKRARHVAKSSRGFTTSNGKVLKHSYWSIAKFMTPLFLWNAALIIIYAISLVHLQGMQGPLSSLNLASRVTYRYTRIRAVAFAMVAAGDAATRAEWRQLLGDELRLFESDYDALMYGGTSTSMASSVFHHDAPASTFASSDFALEFFRDTECLRFDKSTCYGTDSPYYEVTHHGLDVMVRRMLSEMHLLCIDADEDVAYNSSRYMYMYKVGGKDLYEGLQQAAELFLKYSIDRYDAVTNLHTILLVVTICLVLLFVVCVLWPHLARLKADAARQSALLSHVPPEMDVKSHVRAVFRRAAAVNKRSER